MDFQATCRHHLHFCTGGASSSPSWLKNIKHKKGYMHLYALQVQMLGMKLTNNTTHLLVSIGSWDLQKQQYQALVNTPMATPLVSIQNITTMQLNTTSIVGQHDSHSRLPLSSYNTLTFDIFNHNIVPHGHNKPGIDN